ncbi:MAG: hypothetical protein HW374_753 [Bacteroidetes bacterium]|nr:hypothetical protein [Bacteroidota bacterium]
MANKKKKEPEYRLNIFYRPDVQAQKKLAFLVRTIQEFVSFRYHVLLKDEIAGNRIQLNIAGLSAPSALMPGGGPAVGFKEYTHLRGEYSLIVKKLDGATNEFRIDIDTDQVRILESPKNPVILVSTEQVILS